MNYEEVYRKLFEYGEKRPFLKEEFELNELCKEAVRKQLPAVPKMIGDDYSSILCCPVCVANLLLMYGIIQSISLFTATIVGKN